MKYNLRNLNLCLLIVCVCVINHSEFVFSQEPTEATTEKAVQKKDKADEKKIATVKVNTKPMTVYESFDGVFESTDMKEVKADFESWSDLKIETVVEQGTVVTAGQVLMKLNTRTIEKAIKEAEFAVKTAEFDLAAAKLDMKEATETFELDKAVAERTWNNAKQDYEYYQNVQLPDRMDDLAYSEKSAGYFLEYSTDELDQLTQMYTEDELTEESEEIVLKRARRSVESAERNKKRSLRRIARDRSTNVPREKITRQESLQRSEMAYERSMKTLPISKQKKEIALAKAEFNFQEKTRKLTELRQDLANMTLTSPANGVVYYGKCNRGKWVGGSGGPKRNLQPEKKVTANTVLMTIVEVGKMMVRADLSESEINSILPGMRGKSKLKTPAGNVIPATVKTLSRIPLDSGKFDCQVVVENVPSDGSIMPGMGCKLSFSVYENQSAIIVPKASVFSDDEGVTHYVYVVVGDDSTRKAVSVGRTSGDSIEILDGLSEGDEIAKSKP